MVGAKSDLGGGWRLTVGLTEDLVDRSPRGHRLLDQPRGGLLAWRHAADGSGRIRALARVLHERAPGRHHRLDAGRHRAHRAPPPGAARARGTRSASACACRRRAWRTRSRPGGRCAGCRTPAREHDLHPFTANAFVLGDFHGRPVKEAVYAPPWSDPARLAYTHRCASALGPPGLGHRRPQRFVAPVALDGAPDLAGVGSRARDPGRGRPRARRLRRAAPQPERGHGRDRPAGPGARARLRAPDRRGGDRLLPRAAGRGARRLRGRGAGPSSASATTSATRPSSTRTRTPASTPWRPPGSGS